MWKKGSLNVTVVSTVAAAVTINIVTCPSSLVVGCTLAFFENSS